MGFPPARIYQAALYNAEIPLTAFAVADPEKEYERLRKLGVSFTGKPAQMGPTIAAVLDDTCGNRIQLYQMPRIGRTGAPTTIRISLTGVVVNDQERALRFYTEILGFTKKIDMPAGEARYLTVVSPKEPDGTQLLLEPLGFPACRVYQAALYSAGIPLTAFAVDDTQKEYERLIRLGVKFNGPPAKTGPTTTAVFDDTCGNLIQIFEAR